MSDLSKIIAAKTKEIQDAGFFRDRVWYEENDTQSLVDSIRAHNLMSLEAQTRPIKRPADTQCTDFTSAQRTLGEI
jgi:hypothetical protein